VQWPHEDWQEVDVCDDGGGEKLTDLAAIYCPPGGCVSSINHGAARWPWFGHVLGAWAGHLPPAAHCGLSTLASRILRPELSACRADCEKRRRTRRPAGPRERARLDSSPLPRLLRARMIILSHHSSSEMANPLIV
jgi:hypothetical protein